ncbi:PH domain-containing protein [Solwaraspora sp. WMMD406]|uniref:PH domain-containing protein n=1 Tax=Solwaraspora sp. WMMD406 TaxID=3016095 RepID=UPI0024178D62|nr:PH domain-containing protein [Solwaraspora sp. WMMD406]MDG4762811.1 PH domain-containing protein [Solwaraspora sp. WMMD406]
MPSGPAGNLSGSTEPQVSWRVPGKLPVLKALGAVSIAALGLLLADGDPVRLALAGLTGIGLLGWAIRDLIAPVRLAAGPDGITVVEGIAGRRLLPWARIEAITVDRRGHRGIRTELLEVDAGETLRLFGANELGAPPADVAATLRAMWLRFRPPGPEPSGQR